MFKIRFISMLVLLMTAVTGAWAQNPSWVRPGDVWDATIKTLTVNSNPGGYQYRDEIEHVIIANGVTEIGNSAFCGCGKLTSVSIPSSVTLFHENAFSSTGLTSVTIPGNERNGTEIGNNAFDNCENLTTVTLGNGGGKILDHAFKECDPLTKVIVYAQSAWTWVVEAGIFGNTYNDELKIYVPSNLVNDFKRAEGWSVFSDIIEPITYKVTMKEGTLDATNWQGKAGEGNYQALPLEGVAAGTAVTVKYNGTKKVKSVKATKTAAATVTTAPTAKTGVKVGQNEAIVNAGTAEGGTMMYMLNATQPTSTDGFSTTVPTAEGLTAGTYYVWYYVKADDSHTDSEISATGIEVTIAAKTAAEATAEDKGKLIGTDGKIYADVAAATAAGTTAVAMIAYLGNASDCANGLAIALEDVSSNPLSWNNYGDYNGGKTAAQWCSAWNTSKAVTGGTWRFPSAKDWQYMFIGCGSGESYSDPYKEMTKNYSGLKDKLSAAGGTALKSGNLEFYWSSTEYVPGETAWCLAFRDGSNATFRYISESVFQGYVLLHYFYVRACLAF